MLFDIIREDTVNMFKEVICVCNNLLFLVYVFCMVHKQSMTLFFSGKALSSTKLQDFIRYLHIGH